MAGAHACPVCDARFTRPQHVTRHMRSHTGDRPYKCAQCGDQFARSDLLSRHVNKCHNGQGGQSLGRGRKAANANNSVNTTVNGQVPSHMGPCDECIMNQQVCDLGSPCGKCLIRKAKCSYTTKNGKPRRASAGSSLIGSRPNLMGSQDPIFPPSGGVAAYPGQQTYGDTYLPARNFSLPASTYHGSSEQPLYSNSDYDLSRYSSQQFANNQLPTLSSAYQPAPPTYGVPQSTSDNSISSPSNGNNVYHYRRGSLPSSQSGNLYGGGATNNFYPSSTSYVQPTAQQIADAQARGIPLPPAPHPVSHQHTSSGSSQFSGPNFQSPIRSQGQFDDASSSSDFGTSSTPSPSFSYRDSSSRPNSSAGLGGSSSSFGSPTRANAPAPDGFISSLSSAVPLPTPLQLQSFGSFPVSGTGLTPGAATDTKFRKGAGPQASPYLPYQSLEHMSLEDAAAFAAAASNASGNYGVHSPTNAMPAFLLSAGGREAAIQELKDFWSAFISEPLTGGTTGGHSLSKQNSMPSLKTPMASDRFNGNSFLEAGQPTPRALYPPQQSNLPAGNKSNDASTKSKANPPPTNITPTAEDDLKSYQEACLKRETPMLRLNPQRPRSITSKAHSVSPHTINNATLHPIQDSPATNGSGPKPSLPGVSSITGDGSAGHRDDVHFAVPYPPNKDSKQWKPAGDRPTYKRLASQTLGPENVKVSKQNAMKFPGEDDSQDPDAPARFLPPSNSGAPLVSLPLPGYQQKVTGPSGGVYGAWNRQRSISSPSSLRTFDWQPVESRLR